MSSYPLRGYDELLSPPFSAISYQRFNSFEPYLPATPRFPITFAPPPPSASSPYNLNPATDVLLDHSFLPQAAAAATTSSQHCSSDDLSSLSIASQADSVQSSLAPSLSDSTDASNVQARHSALPDLLAPPAKRRRKRGVRSMNREQRLAQHREVDAARRSKEADAVARLHQLVQQEQQAQYMEAGPEVRGGVDQEDDEGKDEHDEDVAAELDGGRISKLAVLEASIALIEQLTAERRRAVDAPSNAKTTHTHPLHAASTPQQATTGTSCDEYPAAAPHYYTDSPSSVPPPSNFTSSAAAYNHSPDSPPSSLLSVLPPSTWSPLIAQHDRSATLHGAGLISFSSSHCVVVIGFQGVVLFVNERFLHHVGWQRSDIVGTLVDPRWFHTAGPDRRIAPFVGRRRRHSNHIEPLLQYPALVHMIEALWRGEQQSAHGAFRGMRRDGAVIESRATLWGEQDEQHDPAAAAAATTAAAIRAGR